MQTSDTDQPSARKRPLRDGLLQFDPPRLIGSRCQGCGVVQYPARDFCPACRNDCQQTTVPLSDRGVVFSYTTVRQSPAGRTPYVLAYVDLQDDVRVMARLEDLEDIDGGARIGMAVKLRLQSIREDDGVSVIGYVFVPDLSKEH